MSQPEKSEWVSVDDAIPKEGLMVICKYSGVYTDRRVTFWKDAGGNPHFGLPSEIDGKGSQPATHWKPDLDASVPAKPAQDGALLEMPVIDITPLIKWVNECPYRKAFSDAHDAFWKRMTFMEDGAVYPAMQAAADSLKQSPRAASEPRENVRTTCPICECKLLPDKRCPDCSPQYQIVNEEGIKKAANNICNYVWNLGQILQSDSKEHVQNLIRKEFTK